LLTGGVEDAEQPATRAAHPAAASTRTTTATGSPARRVGPNCTCSAAPAIGTSARSMLHLAHKRRAGRDVRGRVATERQRPLLAAAKLVDLPTRRAAYRRDLEQGQRRIGAGREHVPEPVAWPDRTAPSLSPGHAAPVWGVLEPLDLKPDPATHGKSLTRARTARERHLGALPVPGLCHGNSCPEGAIRGGIRVASVGWIRKQRAPEAEPSRACEAVQAFVIATCVQAAQPFSDHVGRCAEWVHVAIHGRRTLTAARHLQEDNSAIRVRCDEQGGASSTTASPPELATSRRTGGPSCSITDAAWEPSTNGPRATPGTTV
jgi:hypothetical protein